MSEAEEYSQKQKQREAGASVCSAFFSLAGLLVLYCFFIVERNKVVLPPGVRTVVAPSQRVAAKAVPVKHKQVNVTATVIVYARFQTIRKQRQPMSIAAMIEDAMEGYDTDEDVSSTEEEEDTTPKTEKAVNQEDAPTTRDTYAEDTSTPNSPTDQTVLDDGALMTREGSTGGPI